MLDPETFSGSRRHPARFALTTLALFALAMRAGAGPPAPLSPADLAKLERGELLVATRPVPGSSFREGIGRALLPAPAERLWRALTDYAHYEEFMPFLEESTAEPQPDGSVLSAQRLVFPGALGERRFRARYRSAIERGAAGTAVYRVSWESLPNSGSLRAERGSFTLEPRGGKTLVTCRLYLDPGDAIAFLVNPQTEKSISWILDGLRQHVRRSRYDAAGVP